MATQSYVLRNISAYDINLSDLGIRIPKGKSKNLLDPIYHLRYEDISNSRTSGSILVRLNKNYLIEDAPLDNDFHSYTEVLSGESSDEIPIYVALTEEYKKITKENLLAGSGVITHVADATHDGYLKSTDWVSFSSKGHAPVTLSASATTGGLGLSGQALSLRAATTALDGYLKHADWNTFYNKEPAVSKGNLTEANSSVLTFAGTTTGNVIGSGTSIQVKKASAAQDGYLAKGDFTTFNAKENAQTKGSISETASSVLTIVNGASSTVGPNVTIQAKKASAIQDGYLGKNDFTSFTNSIHNPVTLNASAVTSGLSLNVQELSARAATTALDGYLKHADWNTFYNKENTVTKGNLTETASSILIFGGVTTGNVIGAGTSIQVKKASAAQDGYLARGDFSTFNSATRTFDLVTFTSEYDNGNSGASHTINWNNGQQQKITLNNNCTFAFTAPTGSRPSRFTLKVVQGGAGSYAITWPGTAFATGATAPTLTGTLASVDILAIYFDGTDYHVGMAVSDSKVIV